MSSSLPPTSTSAVPDGLRSLVVPLPGTTTLPSLEDPCPLDAMTALVSLVEPLALRWNMVKSLMNLLQMKEKLETMIHECRNLAAALPTTQEEFLHSFQAQSAVNRTFMVYATSINELLLVMRPLYVPPVPLPLLAKPKKSLIFSDMDEAVGNEQMVSLIAAEKTAPAARDAAGSVAAFYRQLVANNPIECSVLLKYIYDGNCDVLVARRKYLLHRVLDRNDGSPLCRLYRRKLRAVVPLRDSAFVVPGDALVSVVKMKNKSFHVVVISTCDPPDQSVAAELNSSLFVTDCARSIDVLVLVGCERVGKGKGPIYVPAPPSNTDLSEDPYLPGLWTRVIAPCELKGGKFGMIAGDVDEHGVAHGHVAMTGLLGKLKPAVTHILRRLHEAGAFAATDVPDRAVNAGSAFKYMKPLLKDAYEPAAYSSIIPENRSGSGVINKTLAFFDGATTASTGGPISCRLERSAKTGAVASICVVFAKKGTSQLSCPAARNGIKTVLKVLEAAGKLTDDDDDGENKENLLNTGYASSAKIDHTVRRSALSDR